jgi:hypothetical protein
MFLGENVHNLKVKYHFRPWRLFAALILVYLTNTNHIYLADYYVLIRDGNFNSCTVELSNCIQYKSLYVDKPI